MWPFLYLLLVILRVAATILCSRRASVLNRNIIAWGLFGFAFPLVAVAIIYSLKPKNN